MALATLTQLDHAAACNISSPLKLRRFKFLNPLQSCQFKSSCRFLSTQFSPLCQAQAAALAKQSAPSSPAPAPTRRPRSPSQKGRKKASNTEDDVADTGKPGKRVVIVGGGWAGKSKLKTLLDLLIHICLPGGQRVLCLLAGFGAAKHLTSQGYSVTLLDGSPNPGGLSAGWRTPQGRAVEAGVKGFWYQVTLAAQPSLEIQT